MRIGIDARFYGGVFGKGLGRYVEQLILALQELDKVNKYVIFLQKENWDSFQPARSNFEKVLSPYRWYSIEEQVHMPRLLARADLDLVHVPHFNIPIFSRVPLVVTIHDLIITHYPTRHASTRGAIGYLAKQIGYRFAISRAVRRARCIFAVSRFTKDDLMRSFHVRESKIVVTYEGVAEKMSEPSAHDGLMPRRLALTHPYILYVGNAYPHKNLERLIRAFQILSASKNVPHNLQLVLVGREDYFYSRIRRQAESMGLKDAIRFAGGVSDQELSALYRHAQLFVFPSLYEGFGLPPLEAMAHRTPVVAARSSSLPEILGDAAQYCNPFEERDIALQMQTVLTDSTLKDVLISRGERRAAKFTWRKCAAHTLSAYQSALS